MNNLQLDRVHLGDVIEGLRALPDNSVDLVLADPPYGIDFKSNMRKKTTLATTAGIANDGKNNGDFLATVLNEIYRVMKPGTHLYWFTRWDKVPEQMPMLERHFIVKNSLIWQKNSHGMGDLKGAYAPQYENILFAQKGRRHLNVVDGKQRHSDILPFNKVGPNQLIHSHQKPLELLEFLIRKSSDPGDVVLVPFAGSGSDCVAAKRTGRHFIAYEIVPEFVQLATERVEKEAC